MQDFLLNRHDSFHSCGKPDSAQHAARNSTVLSMNKQKKRTLVFTDLSAEVLSTLAMRQIFTEFVFSGILSEVGSSSLASMRSAEVPARQAALGAPVRKRRNGNRLPRTRRGPGGQERFPCGRSREEKCTACKAALFISLPGDGFIFEEICP